MDKLISEIESAMENISRKKIVLEPTQDITSFKSTESAYYIRKYKNALSKINGYLCKKGIPQKALALIKKLDYSDIKNNKTVLAELKKLGNIEPDNQAKLKINISRMPESIREEVKADLDEAERCFENECYRSCVILCGRLIEVCLHAKYFKVTGNDILEKNPGIGLGKLIAKMQEKDIKLDPGIAQQIHLVNNVRIFSVHKKQRPFLPTSQQTEAIMLYTAEIIASLF